jgi:hypothetical protein
MDGRLSFLAERVRKLSTWDSKFATFQLRTPSTAEMYYVVILLHGYDAVSVQWGFGADEHALSQLPGVAFNHIHVI